jgi:hypothetical protein
MDRRYIGFTVARRSTATSAERTAVRDNGGYL